MSRILLDKMFTYLYYCEVVLRKGLLPDIEAKCGRHKWTLQQDGVPVHTARNTQWSTWRKRRSIS